ncbi:DMT family transporter [uncultured Cohaesibacter sp.]|uniref:DMT family transporter n=1 Tax=uncultured Cohaesibacter sp. TaxID=1002546 RepID=UPI00292DF3EE|nr:DMT family transporter [uncultured Cohaesibacter sp.]
MMNHFSLFGVATALIVGAVIGFQAILAARISLADNAVSTGLVMYFAGGLIAVCLLALFYGSGQLVIAHLDGIRIFQMFLGGAAGVIIVSGSAFAFSRVSPAAAAAIVIFGQMGVSLIAEHFGWTGQTPQSIDWRRLLGLVLFAGAIWLLIMPRND